MNFANLHVLHIYQYSKPAGQRCPLAQFNKMVNPLVVSTCMRHIYIFTTEQSIKHIDERLSKLAQYREKFGAIFQPAQIINIENNDLQSSQRLY